MTDSSRTRKKGAGALPMAETRSEYAQLMRQGISNAEACRTLKINRRTGMRWRHGRIVKNAHGAVLRPRRFGLLSGLNKVIEARVRNLSFVVISSEHTFLVWQ